MRLSQRSSEDKSRRRFHHKGFRGGKGMRDDDDSLSSILPNGATHAQYRSSSSISLSAIVSTRYPAYIAKMRPSTQNSHSKTMLLGTSFVGPSPLFLTPFLGSTTKLHGPETHILNSYTNPILQIMHCVISIRKLARSHITTNWPKEHCLLCELGFVVRMFEDAHGTNCQSSNFCKALGVLTHLVLNLSSKHVRWKQGQYQFELIITVVNLPRLITLTWSSHSIVSLSAISAPKADLSFLITPRDFSIFRCTPPSLPFRAILSLTQTCPSHPQQPLPHNFWGSTQRVSSRVWATRPSGGRRTWWMSFTWFFRERCFSLLTRVTRYHHQHSAALEWTFASSYLY